jgi:hypothetical protein
VLAAIMAAVLSAVVVLPVAGAQAQVAPAPASAQKLRTPTAAALSPGAAPARGILVEPEGPSFRLRPNSLASFTPPTLDVSRFAFTPGRSGVTGAQVTERSFRFTPSGGTDSKAVSLGVTARTVTAPVPTAAPVRIAMAPAERAIQPVGYNLDVAVGWNGFALSGGVSRLDAGIDSGIQEGVDVGLSYGGRNWKTGVQATAERSSPLVLRQLGDVERFGIEAGGAYALGRTVSVSGGVRYRTAPQNPSLLDLDADDKRVYIGGAFAF